MLILRLSVLLSPRMWEKLAKTLGFILYVLARRRRRIIQTNIEQCFSELPKSAQQKLIKKNFTFFAYAVLDLGRAWWCTDAQLMDDLEIDGLHHVTRAIEADRPIILLGGHYMNLEIAGRLIARYLKISTVYRPHENEVVNYFMLKNRSRQFEQIIDRNNLRLLVKLLKQGKIIWYAGDQDMGKKQSVFAPFFGYPAATLTALSRLVRLTQAEVIPMVFLRGVDPRRHRIVFQTPWENFPSENLVEDATRHNRCLEEAIRMQPENYLWAHRRFKSRPEGQDPWYPRKRRQLRS